MSLKYSILIVEDEIELSESLRELLMEDYERIDIAVDGSEAIKKVESHKYDLIISDILMPVMSGLELLRNLRLKGVQTPLVFMTGNGTKDLVQSAIKLGAVDFIDKPITIDALKEVVEASLQIEQHKKNIQDLERDSRPDSDLIRSEQMALGIKQVSRDRRKS